MQTREYGFVDNVDLNSLSKEELIDEINNAKYETIKYVNKFLEVEEKWAFTNLLLKNLNSIRQKNELCKTICEGFLKLTNSKVCFCCLFNQDNNSVEIAKVAYSKESCDKQVMAAFVEKVNVVCVDFLKKSTEIDEIFEYFKQISHKCLIIVPIIYNEMFLGYLMLKKEDSNFYNENINFINIFPEHIALILENISLYQESEKRNKRKIEFLAGISHEFKTPLNAIIGFAEVLKLKRPRVESLKTSDFLDKSHHVDYFKYINNILQSSKHLLSLIEDVIDVSRSQYKSLELNYTIFKPKDEIIQILDTLEGLINEKEISLNYTLADVNISADVKRFRQLIYNLISNAIKFNKLKGKINILSYVKDNKFFFEITDSGDGISKRDYEKIFDFFSQVNRSQLKRQLGSGIGLALCKMITDAHQGEINFKSKIKKGSSFWFSLPMH